MHSIWAIAKNTVKQAVRMKIAVVFTLMLVILLPVMGITMTGDGTLKGQLQTFISYGFSLTSLLLCLLTIAVSVYTLTSDIDQRQIYTVLTKPVRRFQLILGKLLGVILLDAGLLTLFAGIIYTVTIYMPQYCKASKDELMQVRNEFFTARTGLKPGEVDVTAEVKKAYERLEKSGELPPDVSSNKTLRDDIIARLTKGKRHDKRSAVVGEELVWNFNDVKPADANGSLFIRFKYDVSANPLDLKVSGKWLIGDIRQYGSKVETPVYAFERRDLIRTFYEIEVPADAVAEDGYLAVVFYNDPQLNNTIVIFPPEDGLEVLYKSDSFSANFLRSALIIFFRLIFLACLGILSATFLSLPVAILFCLVFFFAGSISGFIIESFSTLSENLSRVYYFTIKPIIYLLPQFDKFSPPKFLVPARLLSWSLVARAAGLTVCVKAALLLLVALMIFTLKEIARVII
ncbi:MAG: ABC transporter permease [Planctomycetota bacterium]|jgi:hypothetical protein